MKKNSIVFALSNPNPEIMPEDVPSNVSIIATEDQIIQIK